MDRWMLTGGYVGPTCWDPTSLDAWREKENTQTVRGDFNEPTLHKE